MDVTSHLSSNLAAALALANLGGAGYARGRKCTPGDLRPGWVDEAFALATREPHGVSEAEFERLADWCVRLYEAFAAMSAGAFDEAADKANRLLAQAHAAPVLVRDGDERWHLHFASADAAPVDRWMASFATAAAMLLGSSEAQCLRRCAADRCDLLFLDSSRGGMRRFCSASCQNRMKVAAFRRRAAMV